MHLKCTCLLLLSFFIYSNCVTAASLNGRVKDANGTALAAANIVVVKAGTNTLAQSDITDDDGVFKFSLPSGDYTLKAIYAGYETFTSTTISLKDSSVTLPDIVLASKPNTLKEISVRAQKPLIEVKADKLVVNVENSIVSAGASAMEILARSPGVKVDQNDNVSLKGKQGVTIMMDGKITPLSGDDLANVLKSMPASSIDKIEIISNPGAKYDAAGTAGIINIRTKRGANSGFNGSINASYGQGVYPKAAISANLNYRKNKVNFYATASYSYRYWFNHLMLNRQFTDTSKDDYGKKLFSYKQDDYAVFNFRTPTINTGIDYNLSKKTTVGFSVNGAINDFEPVTHNTSQALGSSEELLYNFNTEGSRRDRNYSYAGNLNLRHEFDSVGKQLAMDVDYAAYSNKSNQDFTTTYLMPDGSQYLPDYVLRSLLKSFTQIRSLKADYINPLRNKAKFSMGLKTSYVTANTDPLFYMQQNGLYVLDTKRSNHFIYDENINALYGEFNKDGAKWSTQLGLRAENTHVIANQVTLNSVYKNDYTQLFPSFAIQRHVDPKNDVGLTLSRRIERPAYQQLNPFKVFIDKTTYREGYPYLNPALSYNIELSHTYIQRFVTTLTYSITDRPITEVIQPSETEDSVTVQTTKNLTRMTFLGISCAYPFQVTKWWSNVTNLNVYYAKYDGFIANTALNAGRATFDINTTNSFVLPKDFSVELSFFYQARQVYGYMDVNPNWMLNAGVQKSIWDKRATIRLNAQDIFWKGYPSAASIYTGYREDFIAQRETRQVTISFVYRIGNKSLAPIRKHNGGAEDEKQRLGGNNT